MSTFSLKVDTLIVAERLRYTMNYFCPLLALLLFLSKSSRCGADCSDDNRIPCTKCSKKNGGVGVHEYVEKLMLEQTDTVFGGDSTYRYKLGGVFYDEDQKLTVSLVATSINEYLKSIP